MDDNLDLYRELLAKKGKYKYICMFGAGYAAKRYWFQFVIDLGFSVDFFSDNHAGLWGEKIINDIMCIPLKQLVQYGKDVLCLVSTSALYTEEIVTQLKELGLEALGLDQHWFNIKEVTEKYLGILLPAQEYETGNMGEYDKVTDDRERIAVYTCIIGDYDDIWQPRVVEERCDYYFLGIEKPKNLGIFQWVDVSAYFKGTNLDNTRMNRFCKMHPHLFFKDYKYSIYMDGQEEILTSISGLVRKIGNVGIGLYGQKYSGDIDAYAEAAWLVLSGRTSGDDRDVIIRQMKRYIREGFPRKFGSAAGGVIVREHSRQQCVKIMETWWHEVQNESRRDELSLFYSIWKNGYMAKDIGKLGDALRRTPEFVLHDHKDRYRAILR